MIKHLTLVPLLEIMFHLESQLHVTMKRDRTIRKYRSFNILRKEVIQPQVPLRLPCYDLVPIIELTFGAILSES